MMILINGGSSSGKSAFAETLIEEQEKKEEVMAESTGKSMRGGVRKTDSAGENAGKAHCFASGKPSSFEVQWGQRTALMAMSLWQ